MAKYDNPKTLMEMLEGRATARAKLGSLEEALEDGNRMLTIDKTNPRVGPRMPDLTIGVYLLGTIARSEE